MAGNVAPPRAKIPRDNSKPLLVVCDRNGEPVMDGPHYLAWHSASGRFYIGGHTPRTYLGRDRDVAVWRYERWRDAHAEEGTEQIQLGGQCYVEETGQIFNPQDDAQFDAALRGKQTATLVIAPAFNVDGMAFWEKVRELLMHNPKLVAQKTGIAEVARLRELPKPKPPLSLDDCLAFYTYRRKALDGETVRNVTMRWGQFVAAVAPARSLGEITERDFQRWVDQAFAPYLHGQGSPETVRHRILEVRAVISYAFRRNRDPDNCKRLLDWMKEIELPDRAAPDPKPISVADFHKLYHAADPKWRAMLLVQLNCAFYFCDLRRLPVSALNLERGSLNFTRAKKNTPRMAVLWPETVAALRALLAGPAREHVFVSKDGGPFSNKGIQNAYHRLRARAGLPGVSNDQIRDGAYTAAIEARVELLQAKILAGHRVGIPDHYLRRGAHMVEDACGAIRRAYRIEALVAREARATA